MISAIRDISQVIVGAFDLQQLLGRVVKTLRELSQADTCSIWLIGDDGKVRIRAAEGYHDRLLPGHPEYVEATRSERVDGYTKGLPIPAEYELGEGLTGKIAKGGEQVRTTGEMPNEQAHPEWRGKYDGVQWPRGGECVSFFGAPLKVQDRTIGVLKIENKRGPDGNLAVAFSEEDEEVLVILANVIAVTIENQRLAEERQQHAEQAWRLISARLAHKIGNQNFAAKGLLTSLQELDLPSAGKELADHVLRCCEGIDAVVNEAKRFSGALEIRKSPCALGRFVESTVKNDSVAGWGAEYVFEHEDPEGPVVHVDAAQLRHMLMELLENSQGFKPENARIRIRTGRASEEMLSRFGTQGEYAFIDYVDNGPGIPEANKEAIFQPFVSFRQGSGLGLSIIRQIVDGHRGEIMECGKRGDGARFLVLLPFGIPGDLP